MLDKILKLYSTSSNAYVEVSTLCQIFKAILDVLHKDKFIDHHNSRNLAIDLLIEELQKQKVVVETE